MASHFFYLMMIAVSVSAYAQTQDAPHREKFRANATYSLSTSGPTHKILLKIQVPGKEDKIIDLHRQAYLPNKEGVTTIYVHKSSRQTYLFDTAPEKGKVSYADLNLKWIDLKGNLGCRGGFSESSFFVTTVKIGNAKDETIYLQAYCEAAHELYIRSFDGNDWTNRFPGNYLHPLTPKPIKTDLNFYTFYIQQENGKAYYIDQEDKIIELPTPGNGVTVNKFLGFDREKTTDQETLIRVTYELSDATVAQVAYIEDKTTGTLKVQAVPSMP